MSQKHVFPRYVGQTCPGTLVGLAGNSARVYGIVAWIANKLVFLTASLLFNSITSLKRENRNKARIIQARFIGDITRDKRLELTIYNRRHWVEKIPRTPEN